MSKHIIFLLLKEIFVAEWWKKLLREKNWEVLSGGIEAYGIYPNAVKAM